MCISGTKSLKVLSLQYVTFKDPSITLYISEHLMTTLKRLSELSLIKCIICEEMWHILVKLVEATQYLLILDLSGNFIKDDNFMFISKLIKKTKSIKSDQSFILISFGPTEF